jgi:hypothetical protein
VIEVWDISNAALVESFVIDEGGGLGSGTSGSSRDTTASGFSPDQLARLEPVGNSAADAIAAFVRARKAELKSAALDSTPPFRVTSDADNDADVKTIRGKGRGDEDSHSDADSGILHDPDYEPPGITAAKRARDIRVLLAGMNFGAQSSSSLPGNRTSLSGGADAAALRIAGGGYGTSTISTDERQGAFLITGSVDRKVTFWDLGGRIDRSLVVSGLESGADWPSFRCIPSLHVLPECWLSCHHLPGFFIG